MKHLCLFTTHIRGPLLTAIAILMLVAGCGKPPAPTATPHGGDLIVHHELVYYKLLSGTQIMFRDEVVVRFLKVAAVPDPLPAGSAGSETAPAAPASSAKVLAYQHDPKTQAGSERLHPYMSAPLRPMPELEIVPERFPPELPQAAQSYRVKIGSHWDNHHLRAVDAESEWVVGLDPASGQVLFQPVRESLSELTDTSYTWQNHSRVVALAGDGADAMTVGVGEFSLENAERVRILLDQVPALGEALRNALRDLGD